MNKSEIRDSTINALLDKAAARNYGQYLSKLVLRKVRGFRNQPVTFDFPVTAIVGPNGGGKTTVLGAAACAYKTVQPRRYFAKSGNFDASMQDWSIEYDLIDRKLNPKDAVRRTASFRNQRWNRDALERRVLVFGVSRTVPVNERKELSRCASGTFSVPQGQVRNLTESVQGAVSKILGKDLDGFKQIFVDKKGRVTLLAGRAADGSQYSEFHFGAGESSIIRMVAEIEPVEEQSLVLIEEIENGLHPVATVRMVEYLIDAAERKKIQAVFTTHSNDALMPLPSKAIWVAMQNRIFQGKLDIHSLRAITGQITAELVIFVEDRFAKTWVEALLRSDDSIAMDHIQVHKMEGDGTAVAVNRYHNQDPATTNPSMCIIDGDSRQEVSSDGRVFRLPGEIPESYVFDKVIEKWDAWGGKLAVALLQPFDRSERVGEVCREVRTTNRDPHLLFAQIGERIGLVPESTVVGAFANIWAQAYPQDAQRLLDQFRELLPVER